MPSVLSTPLQKLTVEIFSLKIIANPKDILIGYHGGCPDGAAAAFMLMCALDDLGFTYQTVAIGHAGKKFSDYVRKGQTVFSLDVSPSIQDVAALAAVAEIIVVDHHASEIATIDGLTKALPNKVVDLSKMSGDHCGASLVHELVMANVRMGNIKKSSVNFHPDVVDMIHKMDVFQHKIPARLEALFLFFKSFLIEDGERNVSVEKVKEMFADKDACIAIGRELSKPIIDRTHSLFQTVQNMIETETFVILLCYQDSQCRPVDFYTYQQLIDTKINGKPTLFLTLDELPNAKGVFNVGLRRAGDEMDVSKVAAFLKANKSDIFISGGGHPYAGGMQSTALVEKDVLIQCCTEALTVLYPFEEDVACEETRDASAIGNRLAWWPNWLLGSRFARSLVVGLFGGPFGFWTPSSPVFPFWKASWQSLTWVFHSKRDHPGPPGSVVTRPRRELASGNAPPLCRIIGNASCSPSGRPLQGCSCQQHLTES